MSNCKRIVGFSGGIDSQAASLWCRRRFDPADVILLNSNAGGNEHPVTTEFIARYSRDVHPVIQTDAIVADLGNRGTLPGGTRDRRQEYADEEPLTFQALAYIKGRFPSVKVQFCSEILKLAPQLRWIMENLKAEDYERYIGVRRDESKKRANVPFQQFDDYFGSILHRPIADWTKQMCFDYVKAAGEEFNPLYQMGFKRVGCAPCVNSSKEDVLRWSTLFPEMIDKVRGWEKANGRTFFAPCVPGKEINWIDEVVEWSRTVRGGKQFALPFFEAEANEGGCQSEYDICE